MYPKSSHYARSDTLFRVYDPERPYPPIKSFSELQAAQEFCAGTRYVIVFPQKEIDAINVGRAAL